MVNLFQYEDDLKAQGYPYISGTDESGIGCFSGPIVAATVVLNLSTIRGVTAPLHLKTKVKRVSINDSKKLSPTEREALVPVIKAHCISYNIVFMYPNEINAIHNILVAGNKLRTQSALGVKAKYHLCDHFQIQGLAEPCLGITRGDSLSISIAAASILAKTARDEYMTNLAKDFPQYNWEKNKGYGTPDHVHALKTYGITPHHRTYYKPIQQLLNPTV